MMANFTEGPVVIDNTVLSNFSLTKQFHLLRETLNGSPVIMLSVQKEAIVKPEIEPDVTMAIQDGWIKVEQLKGIIALKEYHLLSKKYGDVKSPKAKLGDGEAASLIFAAHNNCVLLTDDQGPRKRAKEYNVEVAGTLGVLYFAQEFGLINSAQCNGLFCEMRQYGGFFPPRFKDFYDVIPEMKQKFGSASLSED